MEARKFLEALVFGALSPNKRGYHPFELSFPVSQLTGTIAHPWYKSRVAHSKVKTYPLLALAMFLFVGLAWSLNLTAFNVWVAGGPPARHREIYEHRANIFLVMSIGFLVGFLFVLWSLIRNRKRQTPEE